MRKTLLFVPGGFLLIVLAVHQGSYVTGYKKQGDGSWKAMSDINESEVSPPGGN
ncbi:MAG TPA: hypothetical protein VG096_02690 [Bryobacteraceae bacterium]|jgi:hypothetical protein|nr:hypothetical protein [Bryobacteraceae bacterium]